MAVNEKHLIGLIKTTPDSVSENPLSSLDEILARSDITDEQRKVVEETKMLAQLLYASKG